MTVELALEGPQRGDLADDIAAALAANPAAGEFFDSLAQFYRKAYMRWIDATTRLPDLRAARINELVDLLAAGIKERGRRPTSKAGADRSPMCMSVRYFVQAIGPLPYYHLRASARRAARALPGPLPEPDSCRTRATAGRAAVVERAGCQF